MTKDSEVFGMDLEWVWKVGLFLDENWKGIGKALERRGGEMAFRGGAISAAQGLFHDALSEGVVARCLLQVVDKLRGAMLSCVTAGRGRGWSARSARSVFLWALCFWGSRRFLCITKYIVITYM